MSLENPVVPEARTCSKAEGVMSTEHKSQLEEAPRVKSRRVCISKLMVTIMNFNGLYKKRNHLCRY